MIRQLRDNKGRCGLLFFVVEHVKAGHYRSEDRPQGQADATLSRRSREREGR